MQKFEKEIRKRGGAGPGSAGGRRAAVGGAAPGDGGADAGPAAALGWPSGGEVGARRRSCEADPGPDSAPSPFPSCPARSPCRARCGLGKTPPPGPRARSGRLGSWPFRGFRLVLKNCCSCEFAGRLFPQRSGKQDSCSIPGLCPPSATVLEASWGLPSLGHPVDTAKGQRPPVSSSPAGPGPRAHCRRCPAGPGEPHL